VGHRLLATFGLPRDVDDRLRFMGSYHARFIDLPVSLCAALVQLWDRPPTGFAGDAGHVRLRAMALLMIARVAGPAAEGRDAHRRAAQLAEALGDDTLRRRCAAAARDVA
jgi:hypothetical protein